MSHAAYIALMNNQSLAFNHTEMIETFTTAAEQLTLYLIIFLIELQKLLGELLQYVAEKYVAIFGNNHHIALITLFVFLYVAETIAKTSEYADRMKEAEDQIQYLKKKTKIQEGNIEYILDNKANNELKLQKLTRQLKKLQKEINEYA
jgi:hypothetical protein